MKFVIKSDGTVKIVHNDKFPINRLGTPTIKRASNVEFNHELNRWEAHAVETGELLAYGPNRNDVIKQEVAILESRLTA